MRVILIVVFSVCLFAASCGNRHNSALDELMQANALALEQSVDMYNDKTETDNLLVLDCTEIDFGDIPLGRSAKQRFRQRIILINPSLFLLLRPLVVVRK